MKNPAPKVPSRQVRRREAQLKALEFVRRQFGGFTSRGGPHWPAEMPRRVARQIAFARAGDEA